MKVGILTFHHTTNYGATLQTYALSRVLESQGHQVEVIDYRPLKAIKYYLKDFLPGRPVAGNLAKAWKMRRFLGSHLRLTGTRSYGRNSLKRFERTFDAVVCGSDQIWCIDAFRGYDPSYFLDFVDRTTRKVSYAASAGYTVSFAGHTEEVRRCLQSFQAISVRDANTARLVETECDLHPTEVLDPTLLIDYDDLVGKAPATDYLLIYKMGPMSPIEEEQIRNIARTRNLRILSVGYSHKIAEQNIVGAGPEQWVNYFAHSAYVFTDAFHGSIFAIKFNRPFHAFVSKNKAAKINDLLQRLALCDRIVDPATDAALLPDIDYAPVNERLALSVASSREFLRQALPTARPASTPARA